MIDMTAVKVVRQNFMNQLYIIDLYQVSYWGLLDSTTSVHKLNLASPYSHPCWDLSILWLYGEV